MGPLPASLAVCDRSWVGLWARFATSRGSSAGLSLTALIRASDCRLSGSGAWSSHQGWIPPLAVYRSRVVAGVVVSPLEVVDLSQRLPYHCCCLWRRRLNPCSICQFLSWCGAPQQLSLPEVFESVTMIVGPLQSLLTPLIRDGVAATSTSWFSLSHANFWSAGGWCSGHNPMIGALHSLLVFGGCSNICFEAQPPCVG